MKGAHGSSSQCPLRTHVSPVYRVLGREELQLGLAAALGKLLLLWLSLCLVTIRSTDTDKRKLGRHWVLLDCWAP